LHYVVVATHPISNTTSNTAECKTSGVVFAGIDAVVSSMAGVVRNLVQLAYVQVDNAAIVIGFGSSHIVATPSAQAMLRQSRICKLH
jgi:hypothetical protein